MPIKVYFAGFTPDSKELLYSIAPGRDECPDCRHAELLRRQADYGFYLYDLGTRRPRKLDVPESTRVFQIMAGNRLFIAKVGAYGDQLGMMDLPAAVSIPCLKMRLGRQLHARRQRAGRMRSDRQRSQSNSGMRFPLGSRAHGLARRRLR